MTRPDLTVITPTSDRSLLFPICERYMARQDFDGIVQWIVVDDGYEPAVCTMGQMHIKREKQKDEPRHTLAHNLLAALPHVEAPRIAIFEDDDWYGSKYLSNTVARIDDHGVSGLCWRMSYWMPLRQYTLNTKHTFVTILALTAIHEAFVECFRRACMNAIKEGTTSVDHRMWQYMCDIKPEFRPQHCVEQREYVAMKGLPGKPGAEHNRNIQCINQTIRDDDNNYTLLRSYIGDEDTERYIALELKGAD